MMFWRSRERSARSVKKGNVTPEAHEYGKSNGAAQSTSDFHMQNLKDGLKIFMSDFEEHEVSTKSDFTHATESSVKTVGFTETPPITEDDEIETLDLFEHLVIPEGITRLPFQPLPAYLNLMKTIPTTLRSMNYYQRKVSKFQPIIAPPTSPFNFSRNSQSKHGGVPLNLFTTFFGGSVSMTSPLTPKNTPTSASALSPDAVQIRTGIAWADNLSPTVPLGTLNYYQNKNALFEPVPPKSPSEKTPKSDKNKKPKKDKKIKGIQEESVLERSDNSARNSYRVPVDDDDMEVLVALQYFHSPRTPFSSPLKKSAGGAVSEAWMDNIPTHGASFKGPRTSSSPIFSVPNSEKSILALAVASMDAAKEATRAENNAEIVKID